MHDCPALREHAVLQADMREMIEAEKTATSLVKALKADLATEKQQHDEQV